MSPLDKRALNRLRVDLESDRVERKESAADASKLRRNICALANDLPGHALPGVVFIGVKDDGGCADITVDDRLLTKLAGMKDDGTIMPIPSLVVQKHILSGCEVAAIVVEPSRSPPVRFRGRVWVRVGPTVRQATPEEEQRLTERRLAGARPFDQQPAPPATVETLDLGYIEAQYLPHAVAAEVLEANERSLVQQLESLRLLVGGTPTYGAILGFARDPQWSVPGARVQFLRIDGTEITDPIRDQKVLTGRLGDVLRQLDDLLKLNISVRTEVATASRELRSPDYPVAALQQLARNAVMHRSYEGTNAPVQVYWYSDRVEIRSPGGLYGRVTPENFGTGAVDHRNPLVAEIMHHLGFAQRFGLGIPLARKELRRNGNPEPDFDLGPTHVVVTVEAAS
ncbi:MAG: transcriptional regulator [Gemmatimonadetes bacterium]|nr:transcriptional regulator [Gemmatimonadota bacterium]MYA65162.1 transcriptional regulator [Gemmatimonadota bacterium]MYB98987.1 transcriptional regulator [Gemmatimonadota bacterium]MYH54424.1 transcriptional regulator [Gemmatimonadota bacterium]MYI44780.1 transcriptional regulator [Gemmatimonadota bacterium]